jgi:hypothetical protein
VTLPGRQPPPGARGQPASPDPTQRVGRSAGEPAAFAPASRGSTQRTPQPDPSSRRKEHLPTLAMSAFWFWIVLLVLLCGCGALFVSIVPIFPQKTAGPPIVVPTAPLTTDTPEPSPTTQAITPTPQPVAAKVTADKVNLRAGPSTQADIVGKANKGDPLTLVGRSADDQWYQATVSGGSGTIWIFADTIQIVGGDPKSLPTVNSQ